MLCTVCVLLPKLLHKCRMLIIPLYLHRMSSKPVLRAKIGSAMCIHQMDGCLNPALPSLPGMFSHLTPCNFTISDPGTALGRPQRFLDVTYASNTKAAVGNEILIFRPSE